MCTRESSSGEESLWTDWLEPLATARSGNNTRSYSCFRRGIWCRGRVRRGSLSLLLLAQYPCPFWHGSEINISRSGKLRLASISLSTANYTGPEWIIDRESASCGNSMWQTALLVLVVDRTSNCLFFQFLITGLRLGSTHPDHSPSISLHLIPDQIYISLSLLTKSITQ